MKSIIYILIAIMLTSLVLSAIPFSQTRSKNEITLLCKSNKPDSLEIKQSATIIQKRLQKIGYKEFDLEFSYSTGQIWINFRNNIDIESIDNLLTTKGNIEFYETYTRDEISQYLSKYDKLDSILENHNKINKKRNTSNDIIAYCSDSNKDAANDLLSDLLKKIPHPKEAGFIWSIHQDCDGYWSLYAVGNSPVITKADIGKCSVELDNDTNILISFKKAGSILWQNITSSNIGNCIAITIDNRVFFAPRIMSEIKGGNCMISGDFNSVEANLISAIINTDTLSLEYELASQ